MMPMWYVVNLDIIQQLQHISLPTTVKVVVKYCLMILVALVLSHIYGIVLAVIGLHTTAVIMKMQVLSVAIKTVFIFQSINSDMVITLFSMVVVNNDGITIRGTGTRLIMIMHFQNNRQGEWD
jgi:hypothetical protein